MGATLPMLHPAYIDSGTGSLVCQFLIGSLLGLVFILKVFWRNLTSTVGRWFGKRDAGTPANAEPKADSEE